MTARTELWDRLAGASLVTGAMPADDANASPWYVSTMIAVSAWIASIFMLIFLGLALVSKPSEAMAAGVVVCIACGVAMHAARRSLFLSHLAVAMSLAGQALIAVGVFDRHWKSPSAWAAFAAIEALLAFAAPNYTHRVLTALAAAWSLRFALAFAGVGALFLPLGVAAFVAADRASRRFAWSGWPPIGIGLALAALFTIPLALSEIFWWPGREPVAANAVLSWVVAASLAAVFVAVISDILRRLGVSFASRTAVIAFATVFAAALAAKPVPGVIVALIVLVVAYAQGRRAMCGLAIAGIVVALSHYYYALDTTLLAKSGALLATGAVLLAAGIAVRYGLAEEAGHA